MLPYLVCLVWLQTLQKWQVMMSWDESASYLELAQFLTAHGSNTKDDLAELWRRMVFNIAVSNTDDHLRNHGFIYHKGGWLLAPASGLH